MITATLIRFIDFTGTDNVCLYRFSIPSVPASTIQPDIKFVLSNPGKFENIRVACDPACGSTNFNFSLRLEAGSVDKSIEEIYSVINVNKYVFDDNLDIWWAKPSGIDEDCVYGEIKNNASMETGELFFEFALICY